VHIHVQPRYALAHDLVGAGHGSAVDRESAEGDVCAVVYEATYRIGE
jgi:hypothetical protein